MAESSAVKGKKKPSRPLDKERKPPLWQQLIQFLQEVKGELKKVVWPPRKQVMVSTGVVIILVAVAATFLGLVDWALSGLVKLLLSAVS